MSLNIGSAIAGALTGLLSGGPVGAALGLESAFSSTPAPASGATSSPFPASPLTAAEDTIVSSVLPSLGSLSGLASLL